MTRSIESLLFPVAASLAVATISFGFSEMVLYSSALGFNLVRGYLIAALLFGCSAGLFRASRRLHQKEEPSTFEEAAKLRRIRGFRVAGLVLLLLGTGVLALFRSGITS